MVSKNAIGTPSRWMLYFAHMGYLIESGDFADVAAGWEGLLAASTNFHVFFTPQWQGAWWQVFSGDSELMLLAARHDGEMAGILPLRRQGETLSFIGSSDVCDYMDFVICPGHEAAILSQLLDYLEPMDWKSLDLHSLLPDSITLRHFVPLARQRGHTVETTQEDVSPRFSLPSDWDEYLSRLSRKDRHELRRKIRRLSQVESKYSAVTDQRLLVRDLDDFLDLFGQARDDKREFMTDRMNSFFKAMAHSVAAKGYLRLAFLEVQGKRVASAMYFDCWDHFHLYNSGYDPRYASLSVGLLCKAFCIRDGILERKSHFDFLRGAEPYKYDLGGEDVPIYRCVVSRG